MTDPRCLAFNQPEHTDCLIRCSKTVGHSGPHDGVYAFSRDGVSRHRRWTNDAPANLSSTEAVEWAEAWA